MLTKYSSLIFLLNLGLLMLFAPFVNAEGLYKSIGAGGKVTYSKHPAANARVEKTLEFKDLLRGDLESQAQATSTEATDDVVLYMAQWCGYCRKAKAYFAEKGINYQEIDIDTEDGKNAFTQVSRGQGIPLVFAHGQRIQGYSESAYDAVFTAP